MLCACFSRAYLPLLSSCFSCPSFCAQSSLIASTRRFSRKFPGDALVRSPTNRLNSAGSTHDHHRSARTTQSTHPRGVSLHVVPFRADVRTYSRPGVSHDVRLSSFCLRLRFVRFYPLASKRRKRYVCDVFPPFSVKYERVVRVAHNKRWCWLGTNQLLFACGVVVHKN